MRAVAWSLALCALGAKASLQYERHDLSIVTIVTISTTTTCDTSPSPTRTSVYTAVVRGASSTSEDDGMVEAVDDLSSTTGITSSVSSSTSLLEASTAEATTDAQGLTAGLDRLIAALIPGHSSLISPSVGKPSSDTPSVGKQSGVKPSVGQPSSNKHSIDKQSSVKPSVSKPSSATPFSGKPSPGKLSVDVSIVSDFAGPSLSISDAVPQPTHTFTSSSSISSSFPSQTTLITVPTSSSTAVPATSTGSTNETAASTTSYSFGAGGIPSGHPVATNTTAGTVSATPDSACTRCEGQPGNDIFCGYTAYDNSYEVMPKTCNTVEYELELTDCTVSPDGIERAALCVNGQTPGPLIEANWGDTLKIKVTNSMTLNGTSMHWHGMRQNWTNEMDGTVSITQCALAPGQSMTYTFKAENYGFSWYHSHLSLQMFDGLFGPMRIHGPVTQQADADAGNLIVQDWSHVPVADMYVDAEEDGVRTMDTGLINGLNVWGTDGSSNQTGQRYTVPTYFESGKSYMFSIVNTAIQSTYKFYIDGHALTVISMDYVPIMPYTTDILNINIGQRYQVIVHANQTAGDYWLRFDNQNACATTTQADNIKGIIHYADGPIGTPNSTAYNYSRKYVSGELVGNCTDELASNLVPAAAMTVGAKTTTVNESIIISNSNALKLYRWYLDGSTFQVNWQDPTLYDIYNNNSVPDYSGNLAIELPDLGEWVYVVIESAVPLGHPIHLHGHDFFVLAQGLGSYDSSMALNLDNPPRRDVAWLPGDTPTESGGYLVLAFLTDNPGAWLMHCHIGWHAAMGFALQFIEAKSLISGTVTDSLQLDDTCATWRDWQSSHGITDDDSGV